ncbi:cytochrome P450 71B24-like [Coffea arabica]|uniref:Cytochrome P450 71B24-like n=1 Tax=Coffea arabica TaxID=13443 RepID=A0A6P6VIK0_COFAR|nr:cytochrome P450 71B24-like [Coffea arabica]
MAEDDIEKLLYFKTVVKEILRLYPPYPLLVPRQTIGKCYIREHEIQPETLVFVNAWDPEHWKNPIEFWPERFLDSAIDYRGLDFEFIPFGAGRSGCPGILMGII